MYHFSRKEPVDNVDNVDNSVKNFFEFPKKKMFMHQISVVQGK